MTHKMNLFMLAPAPWETRRVSKDMLAVLHRFQVLRFIVSIKVMFFNMSPPVYLLSDQQSILFGTLICPINTN
jgi:hypothetical protein